MESIKNEFGWAIPLTEEEKNKIWEEAILTVDTNVLLDLYRYHPKTRDSILKILEKFESRLWISNQVITEFFKNRTTVIAASRKDFDSGRNTIRSLPSEINKHIDALIKSNRTISEDLISKIKNKISETINEIINSDNEIINSENDLSQKVSFHDDEIIHKIIKYFEGKVGDGFSDEELKNSMSAAEERFKKKIPPGYEDFQKDGDRKFGDYFIWEQILRYGENVKKPIILITSEKKDDWWERKSGETIGLRPELKQEAWKRTGIHILVYQTENFLSILREKESEQTKRDELNNAIKEVQQLNLEKELIEGKFRFEKIKFQIVSDVEQNITFYSNNTNIGIISCKINRPTHYFTVSGHLEPNLNEVPKVNVELIDSPGDYTVKPYGSTGTTYDFNIHLKSRDVAFDVGTYTFKYHAYVEREEVAEHQYEDLVAPCPNCEGDYLLDINQCSQCGYEAIRECQLCHNEIDRYELGSTLCSYCACKINKND